MSFYQSVSFLREVNVMETRKNLIFLALSGILVLYGSAWSADSNEPICHWRFDEGQGDIAYDSAGDNHGTIYGAQWTTGWLDGALSFDGIDDYVEVPDNNSQQITTNQITACAWIKLNEDVGNTQDRIICKQENGVTHWVLTVFGEGYYPGCTGNQLVFHDSDGMHFYEICVSPTNLIPNQWYHVAATDNAGQIRIYLNGELDESCDDGYGIPPIINAPITIGNVMTRRWGPQFFFNGKIDDARIYDRALSAEEVQEIYSQAAGGLMAHWKFDEGEGDIAYDSTGNSHGTIYGAKWTTGQLDGALSFDGIDDYVEVPDNNSQQITTNQITLSAWIKLVEDVGNKQV